MPHRLCADCGDDVLVQWRAEERRLLKTVPDYAAAVAEVVRDAADDQKRALRARSNEPFADARGERRKAAKRLARLRRLHEADLARVDLGLWEQLAETLTHDPREVLRDDDEYMHRRGLGAAALTMLGIEAQALLLRSIRSERRPAHEAHGGARSRRRAQDHTNL